MDNPVPVLSSSEEVLFKTCRLAHHFKHDLGVSPIVTAQKLSVGIGIHAGIEPYYRGGGKADMEAAVRTWAEERWAEFVQAGLQEDNVTRMAFSTDVDLVLAVVLGYPDWIESEGLDDGYETVSVEDKWYVEMPGAGCQMPVKLDLLQRHTSSGRLRIVDLKSRATFTSDISPYYISEQNANYQLAVLARYEERPMEMAYRELRKIIPSNRSKPPYYREILVPLLQEELVYRAEEYARVAADRFDPERLIYANPSGCCATWKGGDFRVPCRLVHQGHTPEEAIELSGGYSRTDPYARYEDGDES